jgi:hypothetical protein
MLLLQLVHWDEVGVSFGLARFILNFRQPRRLPNYFQPGHTLECPPFRAGRSNCHK